MKIFKLLLITFAICAASTSAMVLQGYAADENKKVVVKGSTTVLPIAMKTAEAFRNIDNNISISISGDGSGNGIKALLEGICDIATSSRSMKDEEKSKAKAKNIKIKEIVIAYDMIVPIVHPSNKIDNLSLAQLKDIYDGTIKTWQELDGGLKNNIVTISRDSSSGTYEIWEEKVMKKTPVRQDALLQASNGAIVSTVSENSRAIGYIGFGYISKSVKPLSVNKIPGTIENGKSGKYPISRKLFLYVNVGKVSPAAQKYIDFILSPEGQ
jgi:phosphate transport system substrate-binding protein